MEEKTIRLNHKLASTKVLGPGNRYVIWTQGCLKRCRNCINPAGQSLEGGYLVSINSLMEEIRAQTGINGVTISGGEPFLQFDGLRELVHQIKSAADYDVMLYSGYRLQEIIDKIGKAQAEEFFADVDIFIDGSYRDELNYGSLYRGSDNQQIYFFTDKYKSFEEEIVHTKNRDIEFDIDKDGQIVMVGIPPQNFYQEFINRIGEVKE